MVTAIQAVSEFLQTVWRWLWTGQSGPAVEFLAVLFGAGLAFRYGEKQWRAQRAHEQAERERAERQATVDLLIAVANEGENARQILEGIIKNIRSGAPEMAEAPTTVLEATLANPLVHRLPTSLQVAFRAYLSALRIAHNMLEARRFTWATTGRDWGEGAVGDIKRILVRSHRLLRLIRREMEKLAPWYGVRRELDEAYDEVLAEIIAINNNEPWPPSQRPQPGAPGR